MKRNLSRWALAWLFTLSLATVGAAFSEVASAVPAARNTPCSTGNPCNSTPCSTCFVDQWGEGKCGVTASPSPRFVYRKAPTDAHSWSPASKPR